jgi:hypothetical protein
VSPDLIVPFYAIAGPDKKVPNAPEGDTPVGKTMSERLGGAFVEGFTSDMPPPPEGDVTAGPSIPEKAGEIGIGVVQGGKTGAAIMGGGFTGARLGAMAGVPFGPLGPVVGGTLGFVGGVTTGFLLDQGLDQFFPLPKREDLVPYREGAKTTGSVIAGAPVAFGIPEMSANAVARWLSGVGVAARRYPRGFMAAETIGGTGSGIGGGMSEAYAPGEAGTRFFAELGGGMATSPYRLLVNQTGAAKGFLTNFAQAFSPDSREAKAANILYSGLVESGEDPKKIIDFLNSPRALEAIRTANPTVGQLTGVPLFTRLEATLAKSHPNYRAEIDKQGEDALSAYKLLIGRLREIGNPQAMTVAADLERRHFMDMVNSRMDLAAKNAADKIDRIKVDSPSTRRQVGQVVKDETLAALDEARELERDLWKKAVAEGFRRTRAGEIVPKAATPSNTMKEFLYVLDGMTPERYSKEYMGTLGSIMTRLGYKDDFYNRFVQGKRTEQFLQTERVPEEYLKNVRGKATNIEDLVQIRSDLLSYARKAARNNDSDEARIYGRLAEAVLDDISKEGHAAYNTARQFSKDLNEYFTRGYANELRATGISGRDRLPAEVLVSKVYGSNADLTALRINEIEDAASFARNQYNKIQADPDIPTARKNQLLSQLAPYASLSDKRVTSIMDAQRDALLVNVNKMVGMDGRVDPNRLQRFVNENKPILDKLGLTADLQDATAAENLLRQVSDVNSQINKKWINQTAFSTILAGGEKPSQAIAGAINSDTPFKSFNKIVELARRADKTAGATDAIDGLKSSVYDYAFTRAGGMNGKFSAQAFEDALFKSVNPDQPNATLVNILRSQGVLSLTEVKNLKRLIEPMKKAEAGLARGETVDSMITGADAVTELALRIIGSRIGTAAAPGGPGSLIAAAAGSKAVRTLFDKYPTMSITKIIEDATKDPQLMSMLLQKGRTVDERVKLGRQLHNYLWTSGYNYLTYEPPEIPEIPATPTTGPSAAQMLRQTAPRVAPPAPPTKGVPGFQLPMQQGPGAPAPGPRSEAAPTQSRQMLASLFPFDTISGMAANQPPPA